MYFISKFSNLEIPVHPDETETKFNAAGLPFTIVHQKVLYAKFQPDRHVPAAFRQYAVDYFNDPSKIGSDYSLPGITGVGEANAGLTPDGIPYEGDDVRFRLGILDTANPLWVAPEHAEEVEAFLLASPLLGQWFIKFDTTLPLPYPAYAKVTSKPADIAKLLQRISDLVEDGQENAAEYVLKFEAENQNRKTIIDAVEAFLAEKSVS